MFASNVQTIGTTAVALEVPDDEADFRPGFSLTLQHADTDPILLGGPDGQEYEVAPNTHFPINNVDPGEVPWIKAGNAGVEVQVLFQGLGGVS